MWSMTNAQHHHVQVSPEKEIREEKLHLSDPYGWISIKNTCELFSKSIHFQALPITNESLVSRDNLI